MLFHDEQKTTIAMVIGHHISKHQLETCAIKTHCARNMSQLKV